MYYNSEFVESKTKLKKLTKSNWSVVTLAWNLMELGRCLSMIVLLRQFTVTVLLSMHPRVFTM